MIPPICSGSTRTSSRPCDSATVNGSGLGGGAVLASKTVGVGTCSGTACRGTWLHLRDSRHGPLPTRAIAAGSGLWNPCHLLNTGLRGEVHAVPSPHLRRRCTHDVAITICGQGGHRAGQHVRGAAPPADRPRLRG